MTSGLSSDDVQQLAPLLGSLSRMVADGSLVSDSELKTLLLATDLNNNTASFNELKRWGRLLRSLHEAPSTEARRATVEALKLRGLPEATVLLAIDTVTSTKGMATPRADPLLPLNIQVVPDNLNFGTLHPGQHAIQELEVRGGPGRVVADSDQLKVMPAQFGAGTTRIRIEAKPMNGRILWTSLKVITASDSLEIPVQAQWADLSPEVSPPPPASHTVSIQVDMAGYSLTEDAQKVIILAQEEARQSHYKFVGTEHLLLSLLRYQEGSAAKILAALAKNTRSLEKNLETVIGRGSGVSIGEIGLTPRVKKSVAIAYDEARRTNQHAIDTQHLLLGLLLENGSIAANLLQGMNINAEGVRTHMTQANAKTTRVGGGSTVVQSGRQRWSTTEAEILQQLNRLFNA